MISFNFPRGYNPANSKLAGDYYFCEKTYKAYIDVIESCVFHTKSILQGKSLILEEWQKEIIAALFATLHKETNKRRYKEAFIYVPRKNGKSLFCSALVIAYLILDKEKGKEVVSVASAQDQASLIYEPIKHSLLDSKSPVYQLDDSNFKFRIYSNPRKIVSENGLNIYKPITADGGTNHGLNVSFSIMDELHAWSERTGSEVYEAVMTSSATRQSPLNVMITTADYLHDSICNRKFEYAKAVAENKIDDSTFLPVLYYLDESEDYKLEENWYKVNPQLGKSIPIEFYRDELKKAENDPTYLNSFKRLYLNIQTKTENKFLDFGKWLKLESEEPENIKRLPAFGGLDLAIKSDLCAFVLEFDCGDYSYVKSWFWIPKEHKDFKYFLDKGFIDRGEIIVTEGNGIDYKQLKNDIIDIVKAHNVIEIGYDPRFASEICSSLYNDEGFGMIEVPQYPRILSEALKDIAVQITDNKIKHDGNTCASWQVSNASCKEVADGLIRLVKPFGKDSTLLKVDFVAAFSMAHQRLLKNRVQDFDLSNRIKQNFEKGLNFF